MEIYKYLMIKSQSRDERDMAVTLLEFLKFTLNSQNKTHGDEYKIVIFMAFSRRCEWPTWNEQSSEFRQA
jgi:hypothetical protein